MIVILQGMKRIVQRNDLSLNLPRTKELRSESTKIGLDSIQ